MNGDSCLKLTSTNSNLHFIRLPDLPISSDMIEKQVQLKICYYNPSNRDYVIIIRLLDEGEHVKKQVQVMASTNNSWNTIICTSPQISAESSSIRINIGYTELSGQTIYLDNFSLTLQ